MPAMCHDHRLIGEILVGREVVTPAQLAQALSVQKTGDTGFVGDILVRLGYVNEIDIVTALVIQCNFPYIAVTRYLVEPGILRLIPFDVARRNRLVPLDRIGNILSVVMQNPLDAALRQEMEDLTHCRIATFISTRSEIDLALAYFYPETR